MTEGPRLLPPPGGEGRLGRSPSGVGGAGVERAAAATSTLSERRTKTLGSESDGTLPTPTPPRKGEGISRGA
jgi:hypothetical protein